MANERLVNPMISSRDAVLVMGGRNPGAITTCLQLLRFGREIDPDNVLGGVGALLQLDSLNIWEDRIWQLFSDVCDRNLATMMAVLRAYQLGQLGGATAQAINHAIDNRGAGLDLNAVVAAVKEHLPNFKADFD